MKKIFQIILYKWLGWNIHVTIPLHNKSIICVAPHTSDWDFIIGLLYRQSEGFHSYYLMKKEWFFWPLGIILKRLDGIPIDRFNHRHLTDYLADFIHSHNEIHIAITPEGTRSLNTDWKKGFYFIALKAHIPLELYTIDYLHKTIICTKEVIPSDNMDEDFKTICAYYANFASLAKYPEKFAINETF